MALPITLHSSLLLDLTDEYGLYENKTKQTLQEPEGQFLRGYGNMVSVAIKMSCGPQLGLLLFCHLFIICQSQVFLCICNPRGIGLLLLCSLNALGEFHETLKIIEKEVRVGSDII